MRTLTPAWRRVVVGSWVVILTLGVATLVLYVDNRRTRQCIADYMVVDQRASSVRAGVAEQERQAFKGTLQTLVTEPNAARRVEAIYDYIALLDENDNVRKANPVPKVPTECD